MSPSISRTQAIPILLGVLCIAGIAIGAATLNSAEPIGASDSQIIDPPQPDDGVIDDQDINDSGYDGETTTESSSSIGSITQCVEFLDSGLGIALIVAGLLIITVMLYLWYNVAISLFVGWTIAPPIALVYFLLTDCGGDGSSFGGGGGIGGIDSAGETIVPATDLPPWLMAVLIGGVLLAAVVLLYQSAGETDTVVLEEESGEEDPELDEFAAAAGRAADRIENRNVDVDNAVYEAWVEMTQLFDVDRPETYTPEEFADEAISLGMDTDDVMELTQLFNEVRYGDQDAKAREEPSLEVLRNIESAYSTLHSDTGTESGESQ